MKPTIDFYTYLQSAFDFFNERLYKGELSPVVFVITRKKRVAGYFKENGWLREDGSKIHEISINPQYFITSSPLEIYQTIVHEMCHQWQYEHGKPSRNAYHNREWVDKMKSMGLKPISVTSKGDVKLRGNGTGQNVSDETVPGGIFEQACKDFFLMGHKLAIVDSDFNDNSTLKKYNSELQHRIDVSQSANVDLDNKESDIHIDLCQPICELYDINVKETIKQDKPKNKTTYQCPNCNYKVWGGRNLPIMCADCNTSLMIIF